MMLMAEAVYKIQVSTRAVLELHERMTHRIGSSEE